MIPTVAMRRTLPEHHAARLVIGSIFCGVIEAEGPLSGWDENLIGFDVQARCSARATPRFATGTILDVCSSGIVVSVTGVGGAPASPCSWCAGDIVEVNGLLR